MAGKVVVIGGDLVFPNLVSGQEPEPRQIDQWAAPNAPLLEIAKHRLAQLIIAIQLTLT
ncbi:MAG: hypothetical protein V7709_03810 [Halioglobus sp.]